jgi:uncharacterized membrane protein
MLIGALLRWAHVISGITWIGMLYFFNFVNVPTQGKLDAAAKKAVNPELQPRALWWFRWGAMSTLIFGLTLFWWLYFHSDTVAFGANPTFYEDMDAHKVSGRALWIMWGMTFGLVMWFNVWFVIWPAQKVILGAAKAGTPPPAHLPIRAKMFSRTNTFLSGPMLVCMVMAHNYSTFSWTVFVVTTLAAAIVMHLAVRASNSVGQTI